VAEVKGHYDERFAPVAEAFAQSLDSGADIGASVAVVHQGEFVLDIWGGYRDAEQTQPWEEDTIVNVWSTTKTMAALCALMLADRGELDLDAPVARYWPEFAQAGKESVAVRHLMSHTAGLAGWEEPIQARELADWERCTSLLAAQAPWWDPGTASGYHALTQGYLIGEVVRRITGNSLGQFFAEHVTGPLGADFHIGLGAADDARVSPLHAAEQTNLRDAGIPELGIRTFSNPVVGAPTAMEEWWRRAEIPAANGHANARSVAAIQSVVSNGGEARGTRLLSEATVARIFEEQSNGMDLALGVPLRFGMGYGLASETMPMGPHSFSWGGYGGSLVFNDLDARLTVTYVMNRMESGLLGDRRGATMVLSTIGALAGG
jgi:CubicO group peptidase (beta-lactamase class C family)